MGTSENLDFFDQPTLDVARGLLGQYLCREIHGVCQRLPITEVEAYDGFTDKASHAHRGKTARNAVMFGPAGRWYVYLCYGIHWMLNIVTGAEGYPAAILLRGAGTLVGPGRLTKALRITEQQNGCTATRANGLWIEASGTVPSQIEQAPRIRVHCAGPEWAEKPYRFLYNHPLAL